MASGVLTDSAQDFLRHKRNIILATHRRDGTLQLSPLWFVWKDGEFVISTVTSTARWHNLKRNPKCGVTVDDQETGRYISASGTAVLEEGDVREPTREIVAKYRDAAEVDTRMELILREGNRVIIRLQPDRIVTRNLD